MIIANLIACALIIICIVFRFINLGKDKGKFLTTDGKVVDGSDLPKSDAEKRNA
jgi:hypothetical protein